MLAAPGDPGAIARRVINCGVTQSTALEVGVGISEAGRYDATGEVRFAVVLYGGVSLAIYMNGIVQELLQLVRATAPAPDDDGHLWWADDELPGAGPVYRKLGCLLDRGVAAAGGRRGAGADPLRRGHRDRHVGGRHQRRLPGQGAGHRPGHRRPERPLDPRGRHRQVAQRRPRRRRRQPAQAAAAAGVAAVRPAHAVPPAEGARRRQPGSPPAGGRGAEPVPVRQPDRPVGHGDRSAGAAGDGADVEPGAPGRHPRGQPPDHLPLPLRRDEPADRR